MSGRNSNSNVMEVSSNRHIEKMNDMIAAGPATIILIYSPTCPSCHTYMPLWEKLCNTKSRTANMISMKADVYQKTPLADKQNVKFVPTVLYVDQDGGIKEVEEPRDMDAMKAMVSTPANLQAIRLTPADATARPSNLPAIPALPIPSMPQQRGGGMLNWLFGKSPDVSGNNTADDLVDIPELNSQMADENLVVPVSQGGGAGTPWSAFVSAMRRNRRRPRKMTRRRHQKKRGHKSRRQQRRA